MYATLHQAPLDRICGPGITIVQSRQPLWGGIGASKNWLLDDLTKERNRYAKQVVRDIETGMPSD